MYGSNPVCLLAISILILAPVMLNGQSDDRRTLSPVFERPLPPRLGQRPPVASLRPRLPTTTPS